RVVCRAKSPARWGETAEARPVPPPAQVSAAPHQAALAALLLAALVSAAQVVLRPEQQATRATRRAARPQMQAWVAVRAPAPAVLRMEAMPVRVQPSPPDSRKPIPTPTWFTRR